MNIDENKVEKGIKYAKIIGIIIIIGLIIFFGYRSIASKTNTSNFYDYLDKNYTKQNDGSYEKKQETDSKQIIYRVLSDDYLFNKEINIYEGDYQTNMMLYLTNEGLISSNLSYSGKGTDGKYGTMIISGTYNINNKKFECKTIQNDSLPSKCNYLKKETKEFYKEVKKILNEYNIDYKYVKKN